MTAEFVTIRFSMTLPPQLSAGAAGISDSVARWKYALGRSRRPRLNQLAS